MQDEGQRDRTPGEAVYGMPVAGAKRIRTALAAVGILDLPGLSEAGTDPGSLPGDPGQETRMRREKLDDYYRTGKQGNQMSRLWKWGPMILLTGLVMFALWLLVMEVAALYLLLGGRIG